MRGPALSFMILKVTACQIENDLNINATRSLKNDNSSFDEKSGTWEHTKSIDNLAIFNDAYAVLILTECKSLEN